MAANVYYRSEWLNMLEKDTRDLINKLTPKQMATAIRGGLRKEMNRVKRTLISNIRSSIRTEADLNTVVRSQLYTRIPGFRVTILPKRKSSLTKTKAKTYKQNRRAQIGEMGLILAWNEEGTDERSTKGGILRRRKKHSTGALPARRFVARTIVSEKDAIQANVIREVNVAVDKAIKRYGKD